MERVRAVRALTAGRLPQQGKLVTDWHPAICRTTSMPPGTLSQQLSPLSVQVPDGEREVLAFRLERHPFLPSFMPEIEFRLTFFELFFKIFEV